MHQSLNDALLFIQPDEVKLAIANEQMDTPTYTLYDFRHNIGHSMAMLNASAEEIAMVLGHASTVAASYYIQATPDIALLKHKALGSNPVWKGMMGLLLTGYSVDETEWDGYFVSGIIRGILIKRVGGAKDTKDFVISRKCVAAMVVFTSGHSGISVNIKKCLIS